MKFLDFKRSTAWRNLSIKLSTKQPPSRVQPKDREEHPSACDLASVSSMCLLKEGGQCRMERHC